MGKVANLFLSLAAAAWLAPSAWAFELGKPMPQGVSQPALTDAAEYLSDYALEPVAFVNEHGCYFPKGARAPGGVALTTDVFSQTAKAIAKNTELVCVSARQLAPLTQNPRSNAMAITAEARALLARRSPPLRIPGSPGRNAILIRTADGSCAGYSNELTVRHELMHLILAQFGNEQLGGAWRKSELTPPDGSTLQNQLICYMVLGTLCYAAQRDLMLQDGVGPWKAGVLPNPCPPDPTRKKTRALDLSGVLHGMGGGPQPTASTDIDSDSRGVKSTAGASSDDGGGSKAKVGPGQKDSLPAD